MWALVVSVVVLEITLVDGQITTSALPGIETEVTSDPTNTSTTDTVTSTTRQAPRDILSRILPSPTRLEKVSSTSTGIIIRFRPPGNYIDDARYSHFRVEYSDNFDDLKIELEKTRMNPNRVILTGLRSGVLYRVSVRTQGRDATGNYLLSPILKTISARTSPPSVSNLRIIPIEGSLTQVLVAWDGTPTPPKGPRYDLFTLSYRITDVRRNAKRPIDVPYRPINAFTPTAAKNITQSIDVEPGATYSFTLVTRSTGVDPTKSLPVSRLYRIPLPGPTNVTKTSFGNRWLFIQWQNHKSLTGITGYVLSYEPALNRNIRREGPQSTTLGSGVTKYNITGLDPGTLYQLSVKFLRSNMAFGKESAETTIYARTSPPLPKVTIESVKISQVELNLANFTAGQVDSIYLEHEEVRDEKIFPRTAFDIDSRSLVVPDLLPGVLYRITITYSSDGALPVDATTSSTTILVRTTPNPPENFSGSSIQGKILLRWNKPIELRPPTTWRYEIVYYPEYKPDKISQEILWNKDGANKMSHSLDDLLPGTRYEVLVYCEVGEDTENDRVARSFSAGPLSLYTQPTNPVITSWTQVTSSQVRLTWNPPGQYVASFDHYVLNLTRIYSAESAMEFISEFLSLKIDRNDREKILKLSYGARYQVVMTTVVGDGENWMQSVVNSSNRRVFETWSPYDSHQMFFPCVWKFTTCGQLGRFGPNRVLCDFEYKGTTLENLVSVNEGIQHWMAPIDGLYRITATGAGYEGPGGKGATASGLFHLSEGSTLKIAVGQQGDYDGDEMAQGGGGGSFVVSTINENDPLVVGGGAGTAYELVTPSPISNGRLNLTGGDASVVGQGTGKGGSLKTLSAGLPGQQNTAGGAGFRGVSESAVNFGDAVFSAVGFLPFYYDEDTNETDRSLVVPLAGGRYELANGDYSEGGFGGGGSGYRLAAGGGGGYTGGGGGPLNGHSGGGGSYIQFTGGTQYAEISNAGPGYVDIVLVGLPVKSPIPVALYLTVAFLVGIGTTLGFGGLLCWVDRCAGRRLTRGNNEKELIIENHAPELYETSVNVTNNSPSASGLYVRSVQESEPGEYRKYSEVDSKAYIPTPLPRSVIPRRIAESEEMDSQNVKYVDLVHDYDDGSESYEEESVTTPSSDSTFSSDEVMVTRGVYAWDIDEEDGDDESSSDVSDEGHTTEESEKSSLPPPPPPPPLEGVGEKHKERFRRKLRKFHSMQDSGPN